MDDTNPTSRPSAEGSQQGGTDTQSAAQRPSRNPDDWAHFRTWPRGARWVVFGLVALLVALAAATAGAFIVVRQSVPEAEGTLEVIGLTSEVEVLRDDFGIPQIYADSMDDLMMAQGYLHAQERFYEMDVRRHVTSGRLSELFGEDTLDADRFIRVEAGGDGVREKNKEQSKRSQAETGDG